MLTADLLTIKLLLTSILTPDNQFMTMEIKIFNLNTSPKQYEYLRFKINDIPNDLQIEYTLHPKVTDDSWVYV